MQLWVIQNISICNPRPLSLSSQINIFHLIKDPVGKEGLQMVALERQENLILVTSTCSYYQENDFQKWSFYQLSIFTSSSSSVRRQVYAKKLLSLQANPKRLN